MSLLKELDEAKREIIKDGFDMSVGELIRIYEREEMVINPVYQRLYRWDESQKTRFIESLLLGIPIPPIFVFTSEDGRWEVIDGLQRLSTIFEFAGVLKDGDGKIKDFFIPSGTKALPSLDGLKWDAVNPDEKLPLSVRLDFERSRIRVEILKKESDEKTKFDLFERLNTGGSSLTPQEVRNCIMIMINPAFFNKIEELSKYPAFVNINLQTEKAKLEQKPIELVLRFLAYRYKQYDRSVDINEWLSSVVYDMSKDEQYDIDSEAEIFKRTLSVLEKSAGQDSFKKYDGTSFSRNFLISSFEVITHGIATNIDIYEGHNTKYIVDKIKGLWQMDDFIKYAKAGVTASTRLINTLPNAARWFS
ncbi:DUF262 domain-containing protein [Kosakonia pseudosacchari]|uniref:DUF262 domain-containing protein n=1 Tax=Kosakonia pseudosacchari TaxID=1646340 RepID=UPI000A3C14A9|nr:DUF262 domain-containing protein [Kosakonia pseudosacchari]